MDPENSETTQQQETQENETQESEKTYTKADMDKLRNSFGQQMSEVQSKLSAYEKQKAAEEEERLLKNKEFDTVLANYKSQIEAKEAEMASYKSEIQTQKIDGALFRSGIKDEFTRIGVLTKYNQMDEKPEIETFIAGLKESAPNLFESNNVPKGKPSGTVGLPMQNESGLPLSERLKSSDKSVVRAAIREKLERQSKGLPID